MPELVNIIEHPGNSKELVEPAMCALRHLTNNHTKVEDAQRLLIQGLDGLQKLEKWLQPLAPRPCLKAALGVVRNLAQNVSNHGVLREGQFVHQVLKLLIYNFDEMVRQLERLFFRRDSCHINETAFIDNLRAFLG